MFEKRKPTGGDGIFELLLAVWCLTLMMLVVMFVLMAGIARASSVKDGFGERAWAGWCEGREDLGWSFYCDPEEERRKAEARVRSPEPTPEPKPPDPPEPDETAQPSAVEKMDAMRAHLDELRALAILEPTHEHVEAYMREQARFMDMAGAFSDSVRRVLWSTPDLDYEGVHPQSNLGKKAAEADLFNTRQQMMAGLNQRYGLIYVGTKRCPVCTIYGPHLRQFAARWKLTVLAVSADGSALSGWPEAVPDKGQLARMQITEDVVPVTALFDKERTKVTLLGVGFLADEELIFRIHTLTTTATYNSDAAVGG